MISRLTSILAAIVVSTLITACGGGGGAEPSTESFNLQEAWENYFALYGEQKFTIEGTMHIESFDPLEPVILDVAISGSGVESRSNLFKSSFEGAAALAKEYWQTATLGFSVLGTSFSMPFSAQTTWYLDDFYVPLGRISDGQYMVVTNWFEPPIDAMVGDKGDLFTADIYASEAKVNYYGSVTYRYEILPDSKTSILIKLSSPVGSQLFRVTTIGQVTQVSEENYFEDWLDPIALPNLWASMELYLTYQ